MAQGLILWSVFCWPYLICRLNVKSKVNRFRPCWQAGRQAGRQGEQFNDRMTECMTIGQRYWCVRGAGMRTFNEACFKMGVISSVKTTNFNFKQTINHRINVPCAKVFYFGAQNQFVWTFRGQVRMGSWSQHGLLL